jgi:hypothetical protein
MWPFAIRDSLRLLPRLRLSLRTSFAARGKGGGGGEKHVTRGRCRALFDPCAAIAFRPQARVSGCGSAETAGVEGGSRAKRTRMSDGRFFLALA